MPLLHVKWFVPAGDYGRSFFSFADPTVLLWLGFVALLVGVAWFLDKKLPGPGAVFLKAVKNHEKKLICLLCVLVGISLVGMIYKEIFILDLLNFAGIVAFLLAWSGKVPGLTKEKGLRALTVLTGVALVLLAFSEKFLRPDMAMEFLAQYDFNFMKSLGFEIFSDQLFVLSVGMMEMTFGLILILGLIPRINILVLAFFFLSTNIYLFLNGYVDDGLTELIGHLPVIATVVMVTAFGSGRVRD
jgi:uncharacterized membrane protein YphA (DoxX/SURF4 family)